LRDFKFGFLSPNAASNDASSQISTTQFQQSRSGVAVAGNPSLNNPAGPAPASEPQRIITLPTFRGFDPAKTSPTRIISLPGFRYCFTGESTIHERIVYERVIRESVEAAMAGRAPSDCWAHVYGKYVPVVSAEGKMMADGFFNMANGAPPTGSWWLFDGKDFF
jgi:hypothetical protein